MCMGLLAKIGDHLQRLIYLLACNSKMSHKTDALSIKGFCEDAIVPQLSAKTSAISNSRVQIKENQVRVRVVNVAGDPIKLVQALGKQFCVLVIDAQPINVVIQCMDRCPRENAGLAHCSPKLLSKTMDSMNGVPVSNDDGTCGATKPLGETR